MIVIRNSRRDFLKSGGSIVSASWLAINMPLIVAAGQTAAENRGAGAGFKTYPFMENIKATLEKHGSSMAEVVKCTVFLADIKEWAAMNEVYVTYFPSNPPARSALGSSGLALGARTEIECMATFK